MSFVPLTGPATFRPADPPRDGVIEFTDERRSLALPVRSALPVLTKARSRDDLHPTVAQLSGAALLGLRLIAAGRFEPEQDHWRPTGWTEADHDQVAGLARAAGEYGDEDTVRGLAAAVADAMPRTAPIGRARRAAPRAVNDIGTRRRMPEPERSDFADRLQARLAAIASDRRSDLPQLVTISLRVEADEEELVAGAVRLVLQVHDEQNPLHLCDAATLWTSGPQAHGFGERARTHAMLALRGAAESWPVLDRLLELAVPDQITLDSDEIVDFLDHGVAALAEREVDVLWPRTLGRDLTARATLSRTAGQSRREEQQEPLQEPILGKDALFAFNWQLALHGEPLTDAEMDQIAHATRPLLKLRDNWLVVDPATVRKAKKRLIRSVSTGEALAATLTGTLEVTEVDHEVIVGASLLKVRERLVGAATAAPVPVPAALQATLRDYQRQGLTWLSTLTELGVGACLADDMGLGKTITLIALHLHRHETADPGATLVVCPASLLGNWEAEIRRFAPGVPVRRFHGSQRDLTDLGGGFVLTTYGTMRRDEALAGITWDLVVADEAQHIKNARSATARALRGLPSTARVALTGTPVENDLSELWAILDWATPGLLGSRNAFRKSWAMPIESGVEPTKARQFSQLISPFLLRRRKSDPGIAPELPAKTETDHPLDLSREQVMLYESFVRDCLQRIEDAEPLARRGLVLKMLTGLKQICNHPAHFLKQGNPRLGGRSEKLDALDELLGTVLAEDGAVLVFTQYVEMARLLALHLSRARVDHQLLHGGTPVREREEMVRRFQAGDVRVFLLSLKAGGTGLNLTAADHVVHFDRWWNPAVEEQATDRAYRIGQTKPVQVHRLITRGTVEERIDELLTRKRAIADSVLASGEAALTELSDDELRDLVTLRRERR